MSETEEIDRGLLDTPVQTAADVARDHDVGAPAFRPGDTIGRYQVRGLLGAGGMGQVFTAFDPNLGRTVALKLLRPDGRAPSARARTRLLREAHALAKLQHPNVVAIHDVGTEGDQVFIAMELIQGETLTHWLAATARPWRAIRDVFLAAGRGLAAAHAVGIVHRDFKPGNVVVGPDRVVVVDFGLALAQGEESAGDASEHGATLPGSVLDLDLTLTGERVGTPRYMAPEQHAGEPVTPRADQFAFATSLWAAFYGAAPFAGQTREEVLRAIGDGPPAAAANGKVPERVHAALVRALALRPTDRWPTIAHLLAELGHDPAGTRRRRIAISATVFAVVGLSAVAFAVGRNASVPDPCAGAEAMVASLWDDTARDTTRDAFRRTGRPYADDTFTRVDASLRQRLGGWTRARRDACEATQVRHEQSDELLDARMACLGRSRMEIAALVSHLREADAAALDRAVTAAGTVGDVTACSDFVALRDVVPPPREPTLAREVGELRGQIAELTSLQLLGKVEQGVTLGRQLIPRARAVGHLPVLAAILDATAYFEVITGGTDRAIELGYEAARVAAEARDDRLVASGLIRVANGFGNHKQSFEAEEVAYRAALTATARAGNPPALLQRLFGGRGSALYFRGEYLTQLPISQLVFALNVHFHGVDSYQAAVSLGDLANAMSDVGYPAEATPMFDRSLASAEKALGPEHPQVLVIANNVGANRLVVGDFDAAAPFFERGLEVKKRLYGPDHVSVALSAHNLGMTRREQRRLPEARALLEEAIRVRTEKLGREHPLLATSYAELARIARMQGQPDEALAAFERAIAIQRAAYSGPHPLLADSYRDCAELLLAMGRLAEARTAISQTDDMDRKLGAGPEKRGATMSISADLLLAGKRPREAIALYDQALALLATNPRQRGVELIPTLQGLGEALLAVGDGTRALATAQRAVTLATENRTALDVKCAADFLLAQARWAEGSERPAAMAEARTARACLAALPYPTVTLAKIDRWMAQVAR